MPAIALPTVPAEKLTKTSLHSIGFKSSNYAQCPICGDQISGNHYGVNTCESCKGFFKRTKKSTSQLKCVNGSNSCPMTIEARKNCSKCRYEKCLAVGMNEGVKSRMVSSFHADTATQDNKNNYEDGEKESVSSESFYLPSLASTRTRTIKRRFLDYNDDISSSSSIPLAKRANTSNALGEQQQSLQKSTSDHTSKSQVVFNSEANDPSKPTFLFLSFLQTSSCYFG